MYGTGVIDISVSIHTPLFDNGDGNDGKGAATDLCWLGITLTG